MRPAQPYRRPEAQQYPSGEQKNTPYALPEKLNFQLPTDEEVFSNEKYAGARRYDQVAGKNVVDRAKLMNIVLEDMKKAKYAEKSTDTPQRENNS